MNNTHETVDYHQNITNVKHIEDENIGTTFIFFPFLLHQRKRIHLLSIIESNSCIIKLALYSFY